MEFKADICDLFFLVLKKTEAHHDMQSLKYEVLDTGTEVVTAVWPEGKKVINVTADSGVAMLKDIINAIS